MEQKEIKISILQMSSVIGDIEANINKVNNLVFNSLPQDCDILVLPEVWTVGWSCNKFLDCAEDIINSIEPVTVHRVVLNSKAKANGLDEKQVIELVKKSVAIP